MATNPFEQPLPSEQARQTQATGNPFDQPLASEQSAPPQAQPGFLSRAYESSPLPGVIDAAKGAVTDFVNAPVQGEQTFHEMTDALKAGDFRGAVSKAAKLLVGSENPFQDAAKSVISGVVKDSHQSGRDMASQIPGAGAVKNYINDVKAGNTAGAIGDVVGGVSSIAPMLLGDEATATKAGNVVGKAADTAADAAGKAKALVSEDAAATKAQPIVQDAVKGTAAETAAGENVQPKAATSVRDAVQNVADEVKGRSKAAYQTLDEASGGRFQRFDDALSNLRDKMSETAGIDDDAFEKYSQRAQDIEASQTELVDSLVRDGKIDSDLAEQAKNDYKKSAALYDVSQQVRASASGLRPELGSGTPEALDPSKLAPRLNKLYDSGRLQQAIGSDGAAKLMQQVDEAVRTKARAIKTVKLAKNIAKWAGIAGGATVLGQGAKHILLGGK
jgi:hypothetical protein